jgi:hypothetical protein
MKLFGHTLALLIGLALLGALGVSGYFALKVVIGLFVSMDSEVAAVISIASFVMLMAALIMVSSIRQATKQHQANRLQAQKAAAYQLFIAVWGDIIQEGGGTEDQSLSKLSEELKALDRRLILYGSPVLIKAHTGLQTLHRQNGLRSSNATSQFAGALLAVRRELGSETRGLTAEELQQLLLGSSVETEGSYKANAYLDLEPRVSLASNS